MTEQVIDLDECQPTAGCQGLPPTREPRSFEQGFVGVDTDDIGSHAIQSAGDLTDAATDVENALTTLDGNHRESLVPTTQAPCRSYDECEGGH